MKKKHILLISSLSLAAILPIGMIPVFRPANVSLEQPVIVENSAVVEQQPKAITVQPNSLDELKALEKTNMDDLTNLKTYDSRPYGIITDVKNQGSEGLCWTYATAAATETALLKTGMENKDLPDYKKIDIDEHNIDYGTNIRLKEYDKLGLNPDDEIHTAQLGKGGNVRWGLAALSMWNSPINQYPNGSNAGPVDGYVYHPAEYYLENADMLGNSHELAKQTSLDHAIKEIKEMIVKYGALAGSYSAYGTYPYTNTNFNEKNGGHAITIVGWDDTISKDAYQPRPASRDGGWIIKNSWGSWWNKPMEGYFYMSYDSQIFDITGYQYTKANEKYQNNYYYDARAAQDATGIESEQSGKQENAAIFPVKKANFDKKEWLKGVNVGIKGEDATITATIYQNVDADMLNPLNLANDPTKGDYVTTITKKFDHGGFKTLELEKPLELKHGKNFSVVVKVDNPTHDAEILYSVEKANDNMTFYNNGSTWLNPSLRELHTTARIKAFTSEEPIQNPTIPKDLEYAEVDLSRTDWQYQSSDKPVPTQVRLGSQTLHQGTDYDIEYGPLNINLPKGGVSRDDEVIGNSSLILRGKGNYANTSKTVPFKLRVGTVPDLQNLGEYHAGPYGNKPTDLIMTLKVKATAKTYKDIKIPDGWAWYPNDEASLNKPVQPGKSELDLVYRGSDQEYYRMYWFSASKVTLEMVPDGNIQPSQPIPKPEINDQGNNQGVPPIVTPPQPPAPAPNPDYHPTPTPTPNPSLSNVSINMTDKLYKVGENVYANANVYQSNLSGLRYEWWLNGQKLSDSSYVNFIAQPEHHNKNLELKVFHNGNTRTSSQMLRVEQASNQDQSGSNTEVVPNPGNGPTPSRPGTTNGNNGSNVGSSFEGSVASEGIDWWVYALIASGSLIVLVGSILAILAIKKKKDEQENEVTPIKQAKTVQVKTIPYKTVDATSSNQTTTIPTFKK